MKLSDQIKAKIAKLLDEAGKLENEEEINNKLNEIEDLKAQLKVAELQEQQEQEEIENKLKDGNNGIPVGNEPKDKQTLAKNIKNAFTSPKNVQNNFDTEAGKSVTNVELLKNVVKTIKERSNAFSFFNQTTVKGIVKIPVQSESGKADWTDEGAEPTEKSKNDPKLKTVELGQNRLYRESGLTQQMLNIEAIDLQNFIVGDIADSMIDAIEQAIFNGDGSHKPTGIISGITKKIILLAQTGLTIDAFKKAKFKMKKSQWKNAKWFMNSDTLLAVDLLKDADGRPLLQPNIGESTGYKIIGIPVETTDAVPSINESGANCIVVLATPDAYHTNVQKTMQFYIYTDSKYTSKGLIGFASDIYIDGKTKNAQNVVGIFSSADVKSYNSFVEDKKDDKADEETA